ncbi:hypothetical protein JXC34_01930 [Candidatus Woesearchaeota archaeon]|nr:hypothetical protein [Candidatus Woesearchaeota archaeon]
MQKRAQSISLFVVIGLLIVVVAGLVLIMNTGNTKKGMEKSVESTLDFSNARTNMKLYVSQCLEDNLLEAIQEYGISGSEQQISRYVELNIIGCLNNYDELSKADIEYGSPDANVVISSEVLFIDLTLPVTMSFGQEIIDIEDFQFTFKREVSASLQNSVLKKGTRLFSEDENLILLAEQDIKVRDSEGNTVDEIAVKITDRNFDGLDNEIVLGELAYQGLPDGITLDPPVKVSIRVSKEDLPNNYDKGAPKLAWYDESTGVWRTYKQSGFTEDTKYLYFSAEVDHFTPMAVVACGSDQEENTVSMQMGRLYGQPIEPVEKKEEKFWVENSASDKSYDFNGQSWDEGGRHLVPELMGVATCTIEDSMEYNAEQVLAASSDFDADNCNGQGSDNIRCSTPVRDMLCSIDSAHHEYSLLRDWDNDDDPENNIEHVTVMADLDLDGYKHTYSVPDSGGDSYLYNLQTGAQEAWTCNKEEPFVFLNLDTPSQSEIHRYVQNFDQDRILELCKNECAAKAGRDIIKYFSGEGEKPAYEICSEEIEPIAEQLRFDPQPYLSGDWINDLRAQQGLDCKFEFSHTDIACPVDVDPYAEDAMDNGCKIGDEMQSVIDAGGYKFALITIKYDEPVECLVGSGIDNLRNPERKNQVTGQYFDGTTYSMDEHFEYPNFYATPMTWGYGILPDETFLYEANRQVGHVGGAGYFVFELKEDGGTCIDEDGGSKIADQLKDAQVRIKYSEEGTEYELDKEEECNDADNCIWRLNYERDFDAAGLAAEDKEGRADNQLKAGKNVLAVFIKNFGVDSVSYSLTAEVEGATLNFKGKGFQKAESCGTSMHDRHMFLTACGAVNPNLDSLPGKEINCLFRYRDLFNVDPKTTSVCELDVDAMIEKDPSMSYCKDFSYSDESLSTTGGYCENGKRICPEVITSDQLLLNGFDYGCYCHNTLVYVEDNHGDENAVLLSENGGLLYCCGPGVMDADRTLVSEAGDSASQSSKEEGRCLEPGELQRLKNYADSGTLPCGSCDDSFKGTISADGKCYECASFDCTMSEGKWAEYCEGKKTCSAEGKIQYWKEIESDSCGSCDAIQKGDTIKIGDDCYECRLEEGDEGTYKWMEGCPSKVPEGSCPALRQEDIETGYMLGHVEYDDDKAKNVAFAVLTLPPSSSAGGSAQPTNYKFCYCCDNGEWKKEKENPVSIEDCCEGTGGEETEELPGTEALPGKGACDGDFADIVFDVVEANHQDISKDDCFGISEFSCGCVAGGDPTQSGCQNKKYIISSEPGNDGIGNTDDDTPFICCNENPEGSMLSLSGGGCNIQCPENQVLTEDCVCGDKVIYHGKGKCCVAGEVSECSAAGVSGTCGDGIFDPTTEECDYNMVPENKNEFYSQGYSIMCDESGSGTYSICNENCEYESKPYCKEECGADPECDGEQIGGSIATKSTKFCDLDCKYISVEHVECKQNEIVSTFNDGRKTYVECDPYVCVAENEQDEEGLFENLATDGSSAGCRPPCDPIECCNWIGASQEATYVPEGSSYEAVCQFDNPVCLMFGSSQALVKQITCTDNGEYSDKPHCSIVSEDMIEDACENLDLGVYYVINECTRNNPDTCLEGYECKIPWWHLGKDNPYECTYVG